MMKRRTVCLCLALLLLLPMLLTGCSEDFEKTTLAFDDNFGMERAPSGTLAENDNFQFIWDDVAQTAFLYDKNSGKLYGSTPYDYYMEQPDNPRADGLLYSPIKLSYISTNTHTHMSTAEPAVTAYDKSIQYRVYAPVLDENGEQMTDSNGNLLYEDEPEYIEHPDGMMIERSGVSSELIDNGVRINYAFPSLRISVSLELILTEKGLEARIPMDLIQEEDMLVYEISVLPYLVSAINGDDSYLMVPSGGGALIDAMDRKPDTKGVSGITYSEPVYGEDISEFDGMIKKVTSQVHLPVFGARDDIGGMIGVIEEGAACGRINAESGDPELGYDDNSSYSNAYASFRVRGYEKINYNSMGNQSLAAPTFSQCIADYDYLSVAYYPLGEDTTYVGMANTYREHLQSKGYLQTRSENAPALSVNLLGGTQTPQSFFGVPYKADTATTNLARAQEITNELNEMVSKKGMLVTLQGYGKGGLSDTVVGGGFKLSNSVGSKKEWNSLMSYASDNNVVMAMDYETIYFVKNGSGFTANNAASYKPSQLDVEVGNFTLNTAVEDKNGTYWYLLSRGKLAAAVDKAIASNKKLNIGAISFNSLSSEAYSDYRDGSYTAKAHMEEDVKAQLNKCTENGLIVVSGKANDYAALNADYVTEAPLRSSKYSCLSEDVPFYSLVFQGYKNLTSPSINLAMNVKETYLQSVATGATLQFTLCDSQHDSLQFEQNTAYISSLYSYWKDDIAEMVEESSELHDKVGNQAIVQYSKENGMSTTVFEDGTTVYVNYTDADMNSPIGTVPAMGFIYG